MDEWHLVWPSAISFPQTGRPLVYLDLNHWISLAKAATGHPDGDSSRSVLDACRQSVRDGGATFVLGASHYFEILKIKSPKQRSDVAAVMEELSNFQTLTSRVRIMRLELSASIDDLFGRLSQDPAIDVVGYGVMNAFGLPRGAFRIFERSTKKDVTEKFREEYGAKRYDAYMANTLLEFERSQLTGPRDEDQQNRLEALGYNPSGALQGAINRADEEAAQRLRLDGDGPWRRERLRDVVTGREMLIEFQRMGPEVLAEKGVTLQDLGKTPDEAVKFMCSMPSTHVSIELKTAWHRNRDKPWSANDVYDIDAMALAVPYSDIVVTEKACHHALTSVGVDRRMECVVLRDLGQLPETIGQWRGHQQLGSGAED